VGRDTPGRLEDYTAADVSPDMSFLEMLDVVNEGLISLGKDPIAFDSDCREGICGMCSLVVNGVAHGPDRGTTVCQLHMRRFKTATQLSSSRARKSLPVVKDRRRRSAFDRIIAAGGYCPVNCGGAPDGNAILISKRCRKQPWTPPPHRLRRVRRLQERLGAPVHEREDHLACPRAARGHRRCGDD
jgi:succinate dehydrogenase / fumarate reductase iron-sulfur subunit